MPHTFRLCYPETPGTVLDIHGHKVDCRDDCADPAHCRTARAVVLADGHTAEYLDNATPVAQSVLGVRGHR